MAGTRQEYSFIFASCEPLIGYSMVNVKHFENCYHDYGHHTACKMESTCKLKESHMDIFFFFNLKYQHHVTIITIGPTKIRIWRMIY